MAVDFVGESGAQELYCVDGSHMFELDTKAEPHELRVTAGVFDQWAKFLHQVAVIHETGELCGTDNEEGK